MALSVVLAGCGREDAEVDPIAFEINGRQVRMSELQAQVDSLRGAGAAVASDPQRFMESYVARQIALSEAYHLGLDQDPGLQRQWENLLIGRLRDASLNRALAEVSVSEDQVLAYYDAHLDQYTKHAQVRAAVLRLEFGAKADADQRAEVIDQMKEASRLAKGLESGVAGFGALAMRFSDEGTSRFKGGDIGWEQAGRTRSRWPDAVQQALFDLSPEARMSDVIETADAVYLLKYMDHRPERVRPLDEALIDSIQKTLYAQARQGVKASLQEEWSRGSDVVIHQNVINQLNFSPSELVAAQGDGSNLPESPL